MNWIGTTLKVDKFQVADFEIQREELETDDKLYNFGVLSNQLEFQTISDLTSEEYRAFEGNPIALYLVIRHSRDII